MAKHSPVRLVRVSTSSDKMILDVREEVDRVVVEVMGCHRIRTNLSFVDKLHLRTFARILLERAERP